jgi:formiminotetrahydrofolate cyclodeaminase/Zn-dependent peptidase ImmA (M78 family)
MDGQSDDAERLIDQPTSQLLEKFGAGKHKPGSGSAAALQGLLSAQLLRTVIALTTDPSRAERYVSALPRLRSIKLELERRIIPSLEQLFQSDSDHFGRTIRLRQLRDAEADPVRRRPLADNATAALVQATEIPIQIAKECIELARYALEVFDDGFQSARGDSGVALSTAVSAIFGALSIVELNLRGSEESKWSSEMRMSRDALMTDLSVLVDEARRRLALQVAHTERRSLFLLEIKAIASSSKEKTSLTEVAIESIAIRLQKAVWNNRDLIWKDGLTRNAFDVLDPDKALECFGFLVDHPATLGQYLDRETTIEVAGQIDQSVRLVSVSRQFPIQTRRFTSSHELGHHLLHNQPRLHRDRPLDRFRVAEPRDSEEWQADKFATYFLMPKKLIKKTFAGIFLTEQFTITKETAFALNEQSSNALRAKCKDLRGLSRFLANTRSYNGKQFYPLSEQFNVSVEAMAIRLEELGLLRY